MYMLSRCLRSIQFKEEIDYCRPFFFDAFCIADCTMAAAFYSAVIFDVANG